MLLKFLRILFDEDPVEGGGGNEPKPPPAPLPEPGSGDMAPDPATPKGEGDPARHDALAKSGLSKLWGKDQPADGSDAAKTRNLEKPGSKKETDKAPAEPAKPAATPKPGPKQEGAKAKAEAASELQQLESIQPPAGMSPSNKKHWETLKSNSAKLIKTAEERAQAAAAEARQAQALLAEATAKSKKQVEDLQKQLDEVKPFRAAVDLQADPEFREKYVAPVEKTRDAAKAYLKGLLKNEDAVDQVDWDDEVSVEEAAVKLDELSKAHGNIFRKKVGAYFEAKATHDDQVATLRARGSELIAERTRAQQMKTGEFKGGVANRLKALSDLKDTNQQPMYPFLKKVEHDDPNNPERVAQVNTHNQRVDEYLSRIESMAASDDPNVRTDTAMWAVASELLADQVIQQQQRIDELTKELGIKQNVQTIEPTPPAGPTDRIEPTEFGGDVEPGKGVLTNATGADALRKRFGG